MMQFTPLEDFWSSELKSQYCVGLSYQVRQRDTKLAALVQTWLAEGKVRQGTADGTEASGRASGSGVVT